MKKRNKILSLIMSAAMLMSTVPSVFAAAKGDCTTEKWLIDAYGNLPAGFVAGENFYTEPTSETGCNSKFSMHFYNEAQGNYNTRIRDKQSIQAGTYYVSFYLKGTVTEGWTKVGLSKNLNVIAASKGWTKTVVGEWTKYEAVLETTDTSDGVYVVVGGGADFYMDNMEVCPMTDGVKGANLLSNGNFEKTVIDETPVDPDRPQYDCVTEKWVIDHYGTLPEGLVVGEDFYTEPDAYVSRNGEFSMHFYNEAKGDYVTRIRDKQSIPAGTYSVSFYVKGTVTEGWTKAGISKNYPLISNSDVWTKTIDGEWTKYEAVLETTAASDGVYVTSNGGSDFYLDDMEVCPVTDGVKGANILTNGDFEKTTKTLVVPPVVPEMPEPPEEFPAPAEDFITQVWQEQYVGIPSAYVPEKDVFAEPSTEESFDGIFSMHMVHPDDTATGYMRIWDKQAFAIGTYKVSFYVKGYVSKGWTAFGLDSAINLNSDTWTTSDAGDGWTKYEAEITTAKAADRAYFRVYGCGDFYLDKFELCPVTNGVTGANMLSNGSFEDTRKAAAGLINPIVYPTATGISAVLTWRNPNYGAVDSVTATIDGGGFEEAELDLGTLILTTGGNTGTTRANTALIQGLAPNNDYVVTLNTKLSQNGTTTEYTTEIPFSTDDWLGAYKEVSGRDAGNWDISRTEPEGAYMNAVPAIDTEIKYSGDSSLRIDGNMFNRVNYVYAPVAQNLKLQRNKLYVLKFKAKSAGVNQLKAMVNAKSAEAIDGVVRSWSNQVYLEQDTSSYIFKDWTEYEFNLSVDGEYPLFSESVTTADVCNTTVTIFPEQMCGSLWIDDVAVYEIDADDEIVSGNLLKDGGMEFIPMEITTSFKDADGKEINKIQSGKIDITTGVRNISKGDDFTTATIIALYNGTKLENVWVKEGANPEVSDGIPTDTWTQSVTVPETGSYEIKVMFWDSTSGLKPIDSYKVLN